MTDTADDDMPPPTLPQEWGGIDLFGFPDIETAQRFGEMDNRLPYSM